MISKIGRDYNTAYNRENGEKATYDSTNTINVTNTSTAKAGMPIPITSYTLRTNNLGERTLENVDVFAINYRRC